MKKEKNAKKLRLSKETLAALEPANLTPVAGQAAYDCTESHAVCSEVHTCVSCQLTTTTL